MKEIPEHLRRRAEEARQNAAQENMNYIEQVFSEPKEKMNDVFGQAKIPEQLLERSRVRRNRLSEQNEGDAIGGHSEGNSYVSRVQGVLDMYSEPCSLLTEHIASTVRDIVETDFAHYSDETKYQRTMSNLPKTRYFLDSPTSDAREREFTTRRLTHPISTVERLVHLELAAPIVKKQQKGLFFSKEVEEFETPGFVYLLAVTRGDVAVPVLQVATNRDQPNCSYVILPEEADQIGDVVVTDEDVKPREEALKELWSLLKDLPPSIVGGIDREERMHDRTLLDKLGATAQLDRVLGVPCATEEFILLHLQEQFEKEAKSDLPPKSESQFHKKKLEVKVGNTEYPAKIKSTKHRLGGCAVRVTTFVELLHAKNFGSQRAFPDIIINPAANDSIVVEGIDDPAEADRVIREFADYLG